MIDKITLKNRESGNDAFPYTWDSIVGRTGGTTVKDALDALEAGTTGGGGDQSREYDSTKNVQGYMVLQPNTGSVYAQLVGKENYIIEVRDIIDLDGENVQIPQGCTLKFEGGMLTNGNLYIDPSFTLEAEDVQIFDNVRLIGTYIALPPYTYKLKELKYCWFDKILPDTFDFKTYDMYPNGDSTKGNSINNYMNSHDCTTILQNLIYDATYIGAAVRLQSGLYRITSTIKLYNGTRIYGEDIKVNVGSGYTWNTVTILHYCGATGTPCFRTGWHVAGRTYDARTEATGKENTFILKNFSIYGDPSNYDIQNGYAKPTSADATYIQDGIEVNGGLVNSVMDTIRMFYLRYPLHVNLGSDTKCGMFGNTFKDMDFRYCNIGINIHPTEGSTGENNFINGSNFENCKVADALSTGIYIASTHTITSLSFDSCSVERVGYGGSYSQDYIQNYGVYLYSGRSQASSTAYDSNVSFRSCYFENIIHYDNSGRGTGETDAAWGERIAAQMYGEDVDFAGLYVENINVFMEGTKFVNMPKMIKSAGFDIINLVNTASNGFGSKFFYVPNYYYYMIEGNPNAQISVNGVVFKMSNPDIVKGKIEANAKHLVVDNVHYNNGKEIVHAEYYKGCNSLALYVKDQTEVTYSDEARGSGLSDLYPTCIENTTELMKWVKNFELDIIGHIDTTTPIELTSEVQGNLLLNGGVRPKNNPSAVNPTNFIIPGTEDTPFPSTAPIDDDKYMLTNACPNGSSTSDGNYCFFSVNGFKNIVVKHLKYTAVYTDSVRRSLLFTSSTGLSDTYVFLNDVDMKKYVAGYKEVPKLSTNTLDDYYTFYTAYDAATDPTKALVLVFGNNKSYETFISASNINTDITTANRALMSYLANVVSKSNIGTNVNYTYGSTFGTTMSATLGYVPQGKQFFNTNYNRPAFWNGEKWVDVNGFSFDRSKGSTSQKPTLESSDAGFMYYDTALKKWVTWNGSAWIEDDGASAGVKRASTSTNRPSASEVYVGFMYFDTTSNMHKPIYVKSISGNTIEWVDATGATVS